MLHKIKKVEAILLTAPYSTPDNMEVQLHLPHGLRTCGMIKIELANGLTGLGEGYLAVFAPLVFKEIVALIAPYLEGRNIEDHLQIRKDMEVVTGYWSHQGAARHVLSALDIAIYDLLAKIAGKPLYKYLNPEAPSSLKLYASGGDSQDEAGMELELNQVAELGISTFKIRARKEKVDKANWFISNGKARDIRIAIDMTQNLMVPGQTVDEVVKFSEALLDIPAFIEEPLGPLRLHDYAHLRSRISCKIAGGEIITNPEEMIGYIKKGHYDIAQPDATVIGGISPLRDIFANRGDSAIYVHCWGGAVGMSANYHAAAAFGGKMVEWPLPYYPIRAAMCVEPYRIVAGTLYLSDAPGLGLELTDDILKEFSFDSKAVYACLPKSRV